MSWNARLVELGIELPPVPVPVANYVPTMRVGDLVYCSGQTPTVSGFLQVKGRVGAEVTVEEGMRAARLSVLNCLAALAASLGSLDDVASMVMLTGYVVGVDGFIEQPVVVNGASLLLEEIFGTAGKHARVAVGVAGLPGDAPVEVQLIALARPS